MKHIKLFESRAKVYWMIKDPGEGYYDDTTYLFDNEKDLLNFTANKVYTAIKEYFNEDEEERTLDETLSELDKCTNAEDMLEILNDAIDNELLGEYNTKFSLETTTLDENIHLNDWIELRRTAKKYNV